LLSYLLGMGTSYPKFRKYQTQVDFPDYVFVMKFKGSVNSFEKQ
jgi:hypothetical protein